MGIVLRNQTMASTREDRHGERYSKAFLEDFLAAAPPRAPLQQQHDMSLPHVGWIDNFHVVPDPEEPGEWLLVVDVHLDADAPPPDLRGYSWSTTRRSLKNCLRPRFDLFLPWPYYNDTALNESFLHQPEDLGAGRWIKKSLDALQIALLVALIQVAIAPVWDSFYKNSILPRLVALVPKLREIWKRGISTDHVQVGRNPDGSEISIYFVLERGREEASLSLEALDSGLAHANKLAYETWQREGRALRMVKLVFEPAQGEYRVFEIQYHGGEIVHIVG